MNADRHQSVTFERDYPAVTIPAGIAVILPAGTVAEVVQTLGGTVTIRTRRACRASTPPSPRSWGSTLPPSAPSRSDAASSRWIR